MNQSSCDSTIALWKIDSDEERRLASEADVSESAKEQYVQYYHDNDPVYFSKGLLMIEETLCVFRPGISNEERRRYITDMVYSLHRFGCMFDEYFLFGFEKLNTTGRESFITDKNRWDYYQKLNTKNGRAIFNDKSETYKVFKRFYKRELLSITGENDFLPFCKFRSKHPSFIVKPIQGSGGRGIYIENTENDSDKTVFQRIQTKGRVVIEELIQQVDPLKELHPSSLNTVRIPTVCSKKGITVFKPFLRIGVGNSTVDNAKNGGIICPVDVETGIVTQYGVTELGKKYVKHPDSGAVIPGFQIPNWDDAMSFVKILALVVPENHYVGWDCALTENGWLMVEGNPQGQFVTQHATKIGCRRELDQLMKDI